jgi:hypothetical protein
MLYFDPTFDRSTAFPADIVVRKLTKLGPAFWLSHDETWLYVRNTNAAPGFGDSWDELSAATWISSEEWTTQTARTGHWRSGDLENVDKALLAFEKGRGGAAFESLRAAFQHWFARNPKESASRNAGNCVYRLALNLKLAKALLRG